MYYLEKTRDTRDTTDRQKVTGSRHHLSADKILSADEPCPRTSVDTSEFEKLYWFYFLFLFVKKLFCKQLFVAIAVDTAADGKLEKH